MLKRMFRSTVLLSYTSMAKSPLLEDHLADARSELVQQTINASPSPAAKARAGFDHVHVKGNMCFTKLVKHAQTPNEPFGLRCR